MQCTWCISRQDVTVWVDVSSLATSGVVECNGVVADASWLQPVHENKHICLAELDVVLWCSNLALQWKAKTIYLQTDSACVHHWVSDTLSRQTRVHTKAPSEILIRCWVATLRELATEYELDIDVGLVKPQWLLEEIRSVAEPKETVCCGWRTRCCSYTDHSSIQQTPGRLDVSENWSRVGMDVTHFGNQLYLSLIDCGPSRFAFWKPLQCQDSPSIIKQLEAVFCERELLSELLTDNGSAFYGERLAQFAKMWGVHLCFWCAHVLSGNGIIERSHPMIKHIVTRTRCSIQEAVYWHNVTPKDNETASTAPANLTYTYKIHLKGINTALPQDDTISSPYIVGDAVWKKNPHGRCTTQFDRGTVTRIYSPHSVCVDGIPCHVKDVHPVQGENNTASD